jgi:hypothetical protein
LTLIWNAANIVFLVKKRIPLPPVPNAIAHLILAAIFVVVGSLATAFCVQGFNGIAIDPYGMKVGNGVHDITAITGKTITVSPANVLTCPAFQNCVAQETWMMGAQRRALVAVFGCIFADLIL